MGRFFCCCFLIFSLLQFQNCTAGNQKQIVSSSSVNSNLSSKTFYSNYVKDSFVISILKPSTYTSKEQYHHVYITDGSLGIGQYILGQNETWKATVPDNCIIIAIAHTGDWESKRPRDFIPSDISKNEKNEFGHAENFYLFLKNELIPSIEKEFRNKKDRIFIGHSFGGLFCLYTLFKEDKLFDRHFAISPAVWANNYELEKIETEFSKNHKNLSANVVMFAGGLEFLNKVLPSTRELYSRIKNRNYPDLQITKEEIGNANHFSIRKPAVDRIFELLKD